MTPERLRECLRHIGWSQRSLASMVNVGESTVRRWADGYPMPGELGVWLESLAKAHEAHPPPDITTGNEWKAARRHPETAPAER